MCMTTPADFYGLHFDRPKTCDDKVSSHLSLGSSVQLAVCTGNLGNLRHLGSWRFEMLGVRILFARILHIVGIDYGYVSFYTVFLLPSVIASFSYMYNMRNAEQIKIVLLSGTIRGIMSWHRKRSVTANVGKELSKSCLPRRPICWLKTCEYCGVSIYYRTHSPAATSWQHCSNSSETDTSSHLSTT